MKREEIAAMLLQGFISKYTFNKPEDQDIVCKLSVQLADELLKQLNEIPCVNYEK